MYLPNEPYLLDDEGNCNRNAYATADRGMRPRDGAVEGSDSAREGSNVMSRSRER